MTHWKNSLLQVCYTVSGSGPVFDVLAKGRGKTFKSGNELFRHYDTILKVAYSQFNQINGQVSSVSLSSKVVVSADCEIQDYRLMARNNWGIEISAHDISSESVRREFKNELCM